MRKIQFDNDTVKCIREYIQSGHTKLEACNKFALKRDTLNRVMRENNITPYFENKAHSVKEIPESDINLVCNLFKNTLTPIADIRKELHLSYAEVKDILEKNFTQYEIDSRKRKLYSYSKLGDKNPMSGKLGETHHNYKGVIEDGNGYLMVLKPDWYTGRKNSKYVFLHSVVMCESLGVTEIPSGFCVHHIDGNKKNNDISNLCLLSTSAHSKMHKLQIELCKVQRLSKNGVGESPKC